MTADCQDIVARLSEPGGQDDPAVREHLASCQGCREAARAVEALARTAQSPSPEVLGHFATRVKAAHLREQDRRQRGAPVRTGLLAGAFAVAGAAAVALLLQFAFPEHSHPVPVEPTPNQVAAVEPQPAPPAAVEGADEWANASDEVTADLLADADDQDLADADDEYGEAI